LVGFEFGGVDLGEFCEGESPLLFAGTEGNVSFVRETL